MNPAVVKRQDAIEAATQQAVLLLASVPKEGTARVSKYLPK